MVRTYFWTLILATAVLASCTTLPVPSNGEFDVPAEETARTPEPPKATAPTPPAQPVRSDTPQLLPDNEPPSVPAKATEPVPNPDDVVLQLQKTALQLQAEGQWVEAETVLQRALRIDVSKVDLYHQLATVRMGQQRFAEAEQIALKGLSYAEDNAKYKASLWEVIAQCRSAMGDRNGANEARDQMLQWMEP